jgi:hypothetical protein
MTESPPESRSANAGMIRRSLRYVVVNLLAGSLICAWIGATCATKMRSATLLSTTHLAQVGTLDLPPDPRTVLGVVAGVGIGVVAAVMGVAGGELLIPTIVLLYGVDIKIAGSLSLVVSLPTLLDAFARYSRDNSFQALRDNKPFVIGHDHRIHRRHFARRAAARGRPDPIAHPSARAAAAVVSRQGLTAHLSHDHLAALLGLFRLSRHVSPHPGGGLAVIDRPSGTRMSGRAWLVPVTTVVG